MMCQNSEFLWSDKWAIEDNKAWMVAGELNVLIYLDMSVNYYKIVAALPGNMNAYRQNPNCIKCEDSIFCMPDKGDSIWCYDLLQNEFQKINITNSNHVEMAMVDFWKCGNILWAVSAGLKQILEIDIKRKQIIGYYNITEKEDTEIAHSAKEGNTIFIVCSFAPVIYEFNIETKAIKENKFLEIKDCLHAISVYKGRIWLSGHQKAIYVWEQETSEIRTLECFPSNFGIYHFDKEQNVFLDTKSKSYDSFTFLESVCAGDYIWFIPFQTNQILYVNRYTYEIKELIIAGEEENKESIKDRQMNCKYILQYVHKNRYIGLYSLKNKIVYEIDTFTLRTKTRCIVIDTDKSESIAAGWLLNETISSQRAIFKKLIGKSFCSRNMGKTIGAEIYGFFQQL